MVGPEAVCAVDGVQIGRNRIGRLFHLADLPRGVDPDHEVIETTAAEFARVAEARVDLRLLAQEMIAHHAGYHPLSDCTWATRLLEAVKTPS